MVQIKLSKSSSKELADFLAFNAESCNAVDMEYTAPSVCDCCQLQAVRVNLCSDPVGCRSTLQGLAECDPDSLKLIES